ncbi:MAG: PilN domain-containing protein [Tepidisphaeraceae bacterium]
MKRVNLIPAIRRDAMRQRVRARGWIAACVVYAVLVTLCSAACLVALGAGDANVGSALSRATRQVKEMEGAIESMRPQLSEVQTRLSVARAVGDQPDWSVLLALVARAAEGEIVLSTVTLESVETEASPVGAARAGSSRRVATKPSAPALFNFSIQGLGKSQAAVSQFVLRLEQLRLFERVELAQSGKATGTDGTTFRVNGALRGGGGLK